MIKCPKCKRKLKKVFHGEPTDELAIESLDSEIIITITVSIVMSFLSYKPNTSLSGLAFLNKLILTSLFQVNFKSPA